MLTTEEVVASHQCPGTTFANGCLESGQIDLAEGTLVAESIGGVALVLVVVERIVLHADCHALLLHALDVAHCHAAREEGVFAHILEAAAIERGATDVDARTEENGLVAIACLFADGLTIAEGKIGVPGGCQAGQRRECRTRVVRTTSLLPFVPKHVGADAVRAIGTPEFGNTKATHARTGELGLRMDDGNLLVECHARQGIIDTLLDRLRLVEIDGQGLGMECRGRKEGKD